MARLTHKFYGILTEEKKRFWCPDGNYITKATYYSNKLIPDNPNLPMVIYGEDILGVPLLNKINWFRSRVRKHVQNGDVKGKTGALLEKLSAWLPPMPVEVAEIDIKNAYPTSALKVGAMDKDEYSQIKHYSKKSKHSLIGGLATIQKIFIYKDHKLVEYTTKVDNELRKVHNMICFEVDQVMQTIAKEIGNAFCFYYVDNIFVDPAAADYVIQRLKDFGYESTIKDTIIERVSSRTIMADGTRPFNVKEAI